MTTSNMDIPLSPNPYTTLGVAKDATLAAIRTAHRKLVLSCHPDKVLDESDKKIKAEQFHQVRQAYEILSDDVKRQEYDQKARLAGMRAEMTDDRGPTRRTTEHTSPRAPPYSPVYEMRGGRRVEERVPNYARTYQDETFVPRFADSRPSNRSQDDFYREPGARKTSGRGPEDKRRSRDADLEYERKMKEAREQKDRKRAKDRKRDMEAKSRNKFSYVDDGSDSETDTRYHDSRRSTTPPRRRYEESRRPVREETRRSSKRDERDIDPETDYNIRKAQEHMMSRREALREVDVDSRSRPSRPRATSNLDRMVNTPAPPPPPPRPTDGRRRSSDRERSDKERSDREKDRRRRATSPARTPAGKKEKNIEIVDSPSSRKPAMASYSSDPRGLKGMTDPPRREPQRSATAQVPPQQSFQKPAMRRAETLPASQLRGNTYAPPRSSKLRTNKATTDSSSDSSDTETDDSDATPVIRPRPIQRHTSYKVSGGDTAYVDEPEEITYSREPSPRSRRSTDRPPVAARGSSTRTPPTRGSSFVDSSDRPPLRRSETARIPPLNTHSSSRGKKGLFAEIIDEHSSPDDAHGRGAPRSPRGSPLESRGYERRGSRDVEHDVDPYKYKSSRRPSYQRNDSVRV